MGIKAWKHHQQRASTYRLHELKHLPLLDFLHLEDILQGYFIEMLPDQVHLTVCLQTGWNFRGKSSHFPRRIFNKHARKISEESS